MGGSRGGSRDDNKDDNYDSDSSSRRFRFATSRTIAQAMAMKV